MTKILHARGRRALSAAIVALLASLGSAAQAAGGPGPTHACRVEGIANELQCGSLQRPLDPARPDGAKIDIHYVVVPAMARNKLPDPVLMLAGGPGQSAIGVAPIVMSRLARLNNRRDLVFIDQRGTGQSAPLQCADESRLPAKEALDGAAALRRLEQCREQLQKLPYGDLRFFTTTLAMQDFDAVREQLDAPQWNLVGGSYGTRAALEYQRQFPQRVRRNIIDGVAPPDMVLPASMSTDVQAALDAVFKSCAQETACNKRFPQLQAQWEGLLKSLPKQISVPNALSGETESMQLTRDILLRAVRGPLYVPAAASVLPAVIDAAAHGRYEGLAGLGGPGGGSKGTRLAMGMHFAVVCSEDVPRLPQSQDAPGRDYGREEADRYQQVCKTWPRAEVPAAFYTVPPAQHPVLLMSGGADPVTPPRHAERVAGLLGAQALHVIVPQAGHGVSGIGCMSDVIYRFIDAKQDADALKVDASCAAKMPRPLAFQPIRLSEVQP